MNIIGPSIHTFRAGWTGLLFTLGLTLACPLVSVGQFSNAPHQDVHGRIVRSVEFQKLSFQPRYEGVRWGDIDVERQADAYQSAAPRLDSQGLDARLLRTVYGWDGSVVSTWLTLADRSAYPIMFGSVPAWWAGAALSDEVTRRDATAFTLAWVATAGATVIGKRLIGRTRPYAAHAGITPRKGESDLNDSSSFPSGHSSLSAVSAAFLMYRYPGWTSGALAGSWAVSVAVSRVWLGVHYPSDVAAGLILGGVAAWAADQWR